MGGICARGWRVGRRHKDPLLASVGAPLTSLSELAEESPREALGRVAAASNECCIARGLTPALIPGHSTWGLPALRWFRPAYAWRRRDCASRGDSSLRSEGRSFYDRPRSRQPGDREISTGGSSDWPSAGPLDGADDVHAAGDVTEGGESPAHRDSACRRSRSSGWSPMQMKKSDTALSGVRRAIETAPSPWCSPVSLVRSSGIGGPSSPCFSG